LAGSERGVHADEFDPIDSARQRRDEGTGSSTIGGTIEWGRRPY
jgi:hypothetical protein